MDKNLAIVAFNKKQREAAGRLATGKIVGFSIKMKNNKRSVSYIACSAPFIACNNYDARDRFGIVQCNSPFPQCENSLCERERPSSKLRLPPM
jgi:hypothetical protein